MAIPSIPCLTGAAVASQYCYIWRQPFPHLPINRNMAEPRDRQGLAGCAVQQAVRVLPHVGGDDGLRDCSHRIDWARAALRTCETRRRVCRPARGKCVRLLQVRTCLAAGGPGCWPGCMDVAVGLCEQACRKRSGAPSDGRRDRTCYGRRTGQGCVRPRRPWRPLRPSNRHRSMG